MKIRWLALMLAIGLPLAARGDTIYATWIYTGNVSSLTRFDSATPWLPGEPFPSRCSAPSVLDRVRPVDREDLGFRLP